MPLLLLVVAGEMTAASKKAKRDPWLPPQGSKGYILCPNTDSCTMAEKYKSFVWDFGPGSKTDDLECKCCHYPFRFNRKEVHSHQGDHTPQTPKSGGGGARPKSNAKPGKQTKEKEKNDDATKTLGIPADLDINVLLQRLTSLHESRSNRLHEGGETEPIDNDVRSIAQFLFAPDKVQPAPSQVASKLKKQIHEAERQATLRNNKILQAQKSIRALQESICEDAAWLDQHNIKLDDLKREHDEALPAARLLPVPPVPESTAEMDTFDPTEFQVSINTGSFSQWTPAAQSEYLARKRMQVEKDQADLVFLENSVTDIMSASPLLQVKEEAVSVSGDEPSFGPALVGPVESRSEPYACSTVPHTPSAPASLPSSASIAAQTAYALDKYGEEGSNVAAGVCQQRG